jgi:hypothetical protein
MGFFSDLLLALPLESADGWSSGAIGRKRVRSLIQGDTWNLVAEHSSPSLLKDVAKAIAGNLRVSTTAELQQELDDFKSDSFKLSDFIARTGAPRGAFESHSSGDNPLTIFTDEGIEITAEDILAYNLLESDTIRILTATSEAAISTSRAIDLAPPDLLLGAAGPQYEAAMALATALGLREEEDLQALEERFNQLQKGGAEAKAALEEDIEQSEQDVKIHMQALLAYHLTTLSEFNQARGAVMPRYEKTYLLDGPPSELVNKLTYVPGSEDFAKITVPEASSLVPMIRLFKVSYNSKGELDKERPEIPLIFKTFTDVDSDFMSGHGAGRSGVGIKSFDWQYNGTSPATVKNDITAKLVLYFQNFNDLLKEQENGFKYVDLLVRTNPTSEEDKEKPIEAPNETGVVENKSTTEGDSKYYEIKATVGWAPNPDYARDFSNKPNLAKSIKNQQVSLFLTLVEHEFSVRQDGTFELTIDYRGRIDGIMMDKRADVILDGEVQRQMCKLTKELEEAKSSCFQDEIESIQEKIEDVKVRARFESHTKIFIDLLQTGRIYYAKVTEEVWEKAGRKIVNLVPEDIGISEEIEGAQVLYEADENLLAFELKVAHEQQAADDPAVNLGGCEDTWSEFWAKRLGAYGGLGAGYGTGWLLTKLDIYDFTEAYELSGDESDWYQCFKMQYNETLGVETPGDKPLAAQVVEYPNGQLGEKYGIREDDGSMIIPYFFLGDLIDIAARKAIGQQNQTPDEDGCNAYYHPNRVENMAIILGSLEIAPHGTQKQWEQINIGDIPICLPYFRDWWARHTTKSSKNTYPLVKFIRDCLKDFALEALGDDLFDGMRAQKLLIKDASISVPANVGGVDPIRERIRKEMSDPKKADLLAGSRLRLESIDNTKPMQLENPTNLTPNDMFFYKVFYLVSDSPDYLRGDKEEDLQRGIQHIVMGSRSGLLKEANFSRSTVTGLREQRVTEESGFNPLSHLADVYNMDARMIGNVIFYPGQYIYLNPIGFGTKLGNPSDPGSPSRAMGLGGYHLITQVSSFIDNGKFETTIEALWETSGGPGSRRNDRGQKTEKTECGSKVGTSNTALVGAPEGIPGTTSNIENP